MDRVVDQIEAAIWRVAEQRFGVTALHERAIVPQIKALSDAYTELRPAGATQGAALAAQLVFFTVADLPKVAFPLAELQRQRPAWLKSSLRIADVGCGCGAMTLGAIAQLIESTANVDNMTIDAFDQHAGACAVMQDVVDACSTIARWPQVTAAIETRDVASWRPTRQYDLILLGTLLNEIPAEARKPLLSRAIAALEPNGVVIAIEPALREHSRELHRVRDGLLADAPQVKVLAPCPHQSSCPMLENARDWCHERHVWQLPPARFRKLASASGLRRRDIKYAYLTLARSRSAPTASMRVVSEPSKRKGQEQLSVCHDGRITTLRRQKRSRSEENASFKKAKRGDQIAISPTTDDGEILRTTSVERVTPSAGAFPHQGAEPWD